MITLFLITPWFGIKEALKKSTMRMWCNYLKLLSHCFKITFEGCFEIYSFQLVNKRYFTSSHVHVAVSAYFIISRHYVIIWDSILLSLRSFQDKLLFCLILSGFSIILFPARYPKILCHFNVSWHYKLSLFQDIILLFQDIFTLSRYLAFLIFHYLKTRCLPLWVMFWSFQDFELSRYFKK